MIKKTLLLIWVLPLFFSCQKETEIPIKDHTEQELKELYSEITEEISKVNCTDPKDWKFTAIGAKPCGGPSHYIAYPLININTDELLDQINYYSLAEKQYNRTHNVVSDCSVVSPPKTVRCQDGKAVLGYW